jgi:aminotransferase
VSYGPEIIMAGGKPVPLVTQEKNAFSLNPDQLAGLITSKTKAILLNFPCNPTGALLSPGQLKKIAAIAMAHDLLIITDEIYSELVYDDEIFSIASLPGMKERTIFLHGFSKAFAMTGYRIGYACGPAELIEAMMKIHQYSMLCASIIAQEAAIEALKNGAAEKEKMRRKYGERRDFIVDQLNEMGMKCLKPKGAFYVFPNISAFGLSSKEFATRLLKEKNVALVPGTAFGACGEGYVRCAYAASMENIIEAMDRIKVFLVNL